MSSLAPPSLHQERSKKRTQNMTGHAEKPREIIDENSCQKAIVPSVAGICAGAGTVASTAMCMALPIVGCILGWGATGLICTGVSDTVNRGKTLIFHTE